MLLRIDEIAMDFHGDFLEESSERNILRSFDCVPRSGTSLRMMVFVGRV
jgi:hypothetical protein